jgi:peptidoglycan/LPS O-acetylase OafA/YrhL
LQFSSPIRAWPVRYELLDGLRGLACLGVLLHHLGVASIGHYSVMVFFVISGYCITASAQSCLRRGFAFSAYMARRVWRIYPPYLIAVAFFSVTRVVKSALTHGPVWHPGWLDWVQNLTLTQWLSMPWHPVAWAAQNPALFVAAFWSLNYEEQFYLVTGLLLILAARWRMPLVRGVLVLAALGLAWNFSIPGGWLCGFFIEYWAHFALGACLYFVLCEYPTKKVWAGFLLANGVLGAYCAVRVWPWKGGPEMVSSLRCYLELGLLSAVSIALLFCRFASAAVSRSLFWRPVAAIGKISYSLYLVHQFNLTLVDTIARHLLPSTLPSAAVIFTKVILHVGLAACFWYLFERPFLNRPRNAGAPNRRASTAAGGAPQPLLARAESRDARHAE